MEEIWKDIFYVDKRTNEIIDYRGLYQISNFGRVKSLKNKKSKNQYKKEMMMTPYKDDRYLRIGLVKNGKTKTFRVHRLVAEMFIPNLNNFSDVNHIDEDRLNNHVSNLEWCTSSYNVNYGTRNKRVADKLSKKVIGINEEKIKVIILKSTKQGSKFGFNHSHISECCRGRGQRKSHKGYKWYYLEDYLNMAIPSEANTETVGTCND